MWGKAMPENTQKSSITLESTDDSRSSVPHVPFKAHIIVVGAEDHSLSAGNKLAFMMHAVRRYRLSRGLFKETKIIVFKGKEEKKGDSFFNYTSKHIDALSVALKKLGLERENVIEAKTWAEVAIFLNNYAKKECIKIERMDFYGHGSNQGFWFSYEENEFLDKKTIKLLKPQVFRKTAKIYFYACQIGNGFINVTRSRAFSMSPYAGGSASYISSKDKEKYYEVNKEYSVAQAISNTWGVSVMAPMNRTNYFRTTMSKDKGNIKMTLIDNGLWHDDGAQWEITTIEEVVDKNMDGTNSTRELAKFISPNDGELWRCNYQNFLKGTRPSVCEDLNTGEKNIPCDGICFPAGLHLFLPTKKRNRK